MNITGINGFKRTGKGEVANILSQLTDDVTHQVGFADQVKVYAALTLGFARDRTDEELIALMDEAKEQWLIEVRRSSTPLGKHALLMFQEHPLHHALTGRQYIQHLGNRARQCFGEDFWIDQVLPKGSGHPSSGVRRASNSAALRSRYPGVEHLIITDVRYPNEAQRIRDFGGVIWEVLRPGTESDGHDSEQPLPTRLVDYQIINDGDLENLEHEVNDALVATA